MENSEVIFRVAKDTDTKKLASAIYSNLRNTDSITLSCLGVPAVNQAVKAVAIARGFVAPSGVDLVCIPAFAEVEVEGEDRTGIKLIVESRA